jgi:hypothetical protein
MKLAIFLALLLACGSAHADISSPQVPQIVPKCGATTNAVTVGEQAVDGTYPGLVRQTSHCSASGRGGATRYYLACIRPMWDANGYLIEYTVETYVSSLKPLALPCS